MPTLLMECKDHSPSRGKIARDLGLALIDLACVCTQPSDFVNALELSVSGQDQAGVPAFLTQSLAATRCCGSSTHWHGALLAGGNKVVSNLSRFVRDNPPEPGLQIALHCSTACLQACRWSCWWQQRFTYPTQLILCSHNKQNTNLFCGNVRKFHFMTACHQSRSGRVWNLADLAWMVRYMEELGVWIRPVRAFFSIPC